MSFSTRQGRYLAQVFKSAVLRTTAPTVRPNPSLFLLPGLTSRPWHDPNDACFAPWVKQVCSLVFCSSFGSSSTQAMPSTNPRDRDRDPPPGPRKHVRNDTPDIPCLSFAHTTTDVRHRWKHTETKSRASTRPWSRAKASPPTTKSRTANTNSTTVLGIGAYFTHVE